MKKIACFDLDGVAVHEHEPFSKRLINNQGEIIRPAVDEFFNNNFGKVMTGGAGLAESIEPYLERFHWQGGVDSLLDFWFEGEKSPNNEVLKIVNITRAKGVDTVLVTDNPAERVACYWDDFLGKYFVDRYVSGETGLKKSKTALWDLIANENEVLTKDIFFTDDDQENIVIAQSAGVYAVLFTDAVALSRDLEDFLGL
jgi:FMN phosphatase YigB (HAD superfamily)